MMKRTVSMFLCSLALTVGVSYGAINITWGVSGQQLKDNNGLYIQGTNSATGYLVGGFVQLIWTGADGQIAGFDETFSNGLNPVWDDRVAATGWMGEGVLSNPKAGRFSDTESVSVGNSLGATFYIRFFTAPAGTFGSGIIPAASDRKSVV